MFECEKLFLLMEVGTIAFFFNPTEGAKMFWSDFGLA